MPNPLTSEQLNTLQGFVNNNDVAGYYDALISYGYNYGALGLTAFQGTIPDGAIAQNYLRYVASQNGVVVDNSVLSAISIDLMRSDLAARQANGGADLTWQQIEAYHSTVFGNFNIPITAWTAYIPLQLGGDSIWNQMLSGGNSWLSGTEITAEVGQFALPDAENQLPETSQDQLTAITWLSNLWEADKSSLLNNTFSANGTSVTLDNEGYDFSFSDLSGVTFSLTPINPYSGAYTITSNDSLSVELENNAVSTFSLGSVATFTTTSGDTVQINTGTGSGSFDLGGTTESFSSGSDVEIGDGVIRVGSPTDGLGTDYFTDSSGNFQFSSFGFLGLSDTTYANAASDASTLESSVNTDVASDSPTAVPSSSWNNWLTVSLTPLSQIGQQGDGTGGDGTPLSGGSREIGSE